MSATQWTKGKAPARTLRYYPSDIIDSIVTALNTGPYEWRFTGTMHLEIRAVNSHERLSLTMGKNAGNPVYAGKWRSFLRKQERFEAALKTAKAERQKCGAS